MWVGSLKNVKWVIWFERVEIFVVYFLIVGVCFLVIVCFIISMLDVLIFLLILVGLVMYKWIREIFESVYICIILL